MRFPFPLFPAEFEVPDVWWNVSGMADFDIQQQHYYFESSKDLSVISLSEVIPPPRFHTSPRSFNGFDEIRMIQILTGIAEGKKIPPIKTIQLPEVRDYSRATEVYRYVVCDGFHRFYASVAAGFREIPAEIRNPQA